MIIYGDYVYRWDCVSFAIDVREKREAAGLTQGELAAQVNGYSHYYINRIESGVYESNISLRDYVKLCNILNLEPMRYFDTEPA